MSRLRVRIPALFVVGVLLFAACGTGDSDDAGGNGDGNGNGSGVDPGDCPLGAIDEAGSPVQIQFWHAMTDANQETLDALVAEYNSSQDEVEVEAIFQGEYEENLQKYTTAVRGADAADLPDLIQLEDTATQTMIDSGTVLPAQACVEADDYDLSDYIEKTLAFYTVQDILYPLPWNVSNLLLYYNKQAFEAADLDPDDPPATLAQIREASQAIVDAGAAEAGFALKLDPWWLEQITASANEEFVNNENGRADRATAVTFNNDAGVDVYEWMNDMVADGLALNAGSPVGGNFDNLLAIGSGGAAMTMDTTAALGTIRAVLETGDFPNVTLGVGPRASLESEEPNAVVAGGANFIINRSSPAEQEAAWRFTTWLNEPEQQATWAIGTGYIPIRVSAADLPQIQELWTDDPDFKVAYDQLIGGELTPATEGPVIGPYREVRDVVIGSFEAMLGEGVAPEDAISSAATDSDAVISDYNARN